jgi:hypothetical protein
VSLDFSRLPFADLPHQQESSTAAIWIQVLFGPDIAVVRRYERTTVLDERSVQLLGS